MRAFLIGLAALIAVPLAAPGCGVPPAHAERDTYPTIFVGDDASQVRRKWGDPDSIEVFHDAVSGADVTTWRYDVRRGFGTERVTSFVRFRDGKVFEVVQPGPTEQHEPD
ncbi:MAG: hypothetical protein ACRELB_14040, partial [Polyangiaceae bacterium]